MMMKHIFQQPVEKLFDASASSWLAALSVALVQYMMDERFFLSWLVILGCSNVSDWIAGRWAARATATFNPTRSREGLYSKALGILIVCLLRSVEATLPWMGVPSTRGLLASTIAVLLVLEDVDSLDRHRQTLGKPPVPLLSATIERMRHLTGAERRVTPTRPAAEEGS